MALLQELQLRHHLAPTHQLSSIYFGGGTPSLIDAKYIVSILNEIEKVGFSFNSQTEVTLEINPATVDPKKLETYLLAGVNRFSVGTQTFNDALLSACGREHSAKDTVNTLKVLNEFNVKYSADLLFALPKQSLSEVALDVATLLQFKPHHISTYCLTVPSGHPMNRERAPEEEQLEMFNLIEQELSLYGMQRYEISNFSLPKMSSQHNRLYWEDKSYWGLGVSAHSYYSGKTDAEPYGLRFWNSKNLNEYLESTALKPDSRPVPDPQLEVLSVHESMTDFCHMHLRTLAGLPLNAALNKFGSNMPFINQRLAPLLDQGLVEKVEQNIRLTKKGVLISNKVFESLTFLKDELS